MGAARFGTQADIYACGKIRVVEKIIGKVEIAGVGKCPFVCIRPYPIAGSLIALAARKPKAKDKSQSKKKREQAKLLHIQSSVPGPGAPKGTGNVVTY